MSVAHELSLDLTTYIGHRMEVLVYGSIDGGTQQALDDVWNGVMANKYIEIWGWMMRREVFFFSVESLV
jgi:hypothetical protein